MEGIPITRAQTIREVLLTEVDITLEEFIAVAKYHATLHFSPEYLAKVQAGQALIRQFLNEGRAIYGVTTGFGDNVKYPIPATAAVQLQKNILRSHACAVGDPLSEEEVRAIMLMIILNTGSGCSGVASSTLELLRTFLNQGFYPFAPGEGSVGYLAVEAHICLTLIGEGYFLKNGQRTPALDFLSEHDLVPVTLGCKEGLALVSGTTSATALGLLALYHGLYAEKHMEIINGLVYESLKATPKALLPQIHAMKRHRQQQRAAKTLSDLLQGSQICDKYENVKVQDACLQRTLPQMTGACKELLAETFQVLMDEAHSVSDNPIVLPGEEGGEAYMNGNFDGTYVATHCDMLCLAFAKLGNIMERCTDRLVNHHISDGLPPFLITNPGLNSGFMIPQYTQAGLLGQIKLLAAPASVDSITTCAGQEDPVSMAYHAARKANRSAHLLLEMTALEYMTAVQAVDLTVSQTGYAQSPILQKMRDLPRKNIPFLENDRYLYHDIELYRTLIDSGELLQRAEGYLGYHI